MVAVLQPLGTGRQIVLDRAVVLIGRSSDCDAVVDASTKISRIHCAVVQVDNSWFVRDLGSMNGVWVNGKRVSRERQLLPGAKVALGDVPFQFLDNVALPPKGAPVRPVLTSEADASQYHPVLIDAAATVRASRSDLIDIVEVVDEVEIIEAVEVVEVVDAVDAIEVIDDEDIMNASESGMGWASRSGDGYRSGGNHPVVPRRSPYPPPLNPASSSAPRVPPVSNPAPASGPPAAAPSPAPAAPPLRARRRSSEDDVIPLPDRPETVELEEAVDIVDAEEVVSESAVVLDVLEVVEPVLVSQEVAIIEDVEVIESVPEVEVIQDVDVIDVELVDDPPFRPRPRRPRR